jgi:hypothetical protein
MTSRIINYSSQINKLIGRLKIQEVDKTKYFLHTRSIIPFQSSTYHLRKPPMLRNFYMALSTPISRRNSQ